MAATFTAEYMTTETTTGDTIRIDLHRTALDQNGDIDWNNLGPALTTGTMTLKNATHEDGGHWDYSELAALTKSWELTPWGPSISGGGTHPTHQMHKAV